MRTLKLRLVGTTPILLHKISQHQDRKAIASNIVNGINIGEEAKNLMLVDNLGNPAVSVSWLWDALRVGCSRIVTNRKQYSFMNFQPLVSLPMGLIPISRKSESDPVWTVYKSVQHSKQGSKKMILVVAPMFKTWEVKLSISFNENNIDTSLISSIFIEAGKAGIGLFHPPKKHFGQFHCTVM